MGVAASAGPGVDGAAYLDSLRRSGGPYYRQLQEVYQEIRGFGSIPPGAMLQRYRQLSQRMEAVTAGLRAYAQATAALEACGQPAASASGSSGSQGDAPGSGSAGASGEQDGAAPGRPSHRYQRCRALEQPAAAAQSQLSTGSVPPPSPSVPPAVQSSPAGGQGAAGQQHRSGGSSAVRRLKLGRRRGPLFGDSSKS